MCNILENKDSWISWRCMILLQRTVSAKCLVHFQVKCTPKRDVTEWNTSFDLNWVFMKFPNIYLFWDIFFDVKNGIPRQKTSRSNFYLFIHLFIFKLQEPLISQSKWYAIANLTFHTFTCLMCQSFYLSDSPTLGSLTWWSADTFFAGFFYFFWQYLWL